MKVSSIWLAPHARDDCWAASFVRGYNRAYNDYCVPKFEDEKRIADIASCSIFWLLLSMRFLILGAAIGLALPMSGALGARASSTARVCIERDGQNGSLNTSPTILSIRSEATGQVLARKRFEDAGSLCAKVPRGRYRLIVRLAEPWTRSLPLHWWTREYPLDLSRGDARYVMSNPETNDEFQAMIAGRIGWHRLWPIHRVN
jgi:hypothetical protein